MKQGSLSEYFKAIAAKRLTEVEANAMRSNQHEFNGVRALREMLGEPDGKVPYAARMMYLSDEQAEPVVEDAQLTWYDARQQARIERGVMRWEYRLYFPDTAVSASFSAGDLLIIAKRQDDSLLVIVGKDGSSIGRQLEWLFGIGNASSEYLLRFEREFDSERLGFASRFILENIGIEIESVDDSHLDEMLTKFNGRFPTTLEFSSYARSKARHVDCREDPDAALMSWMEKEEQLFRAMERHFVGQRLSQGFFQADGTPDVDGFVSFSLSVQNRRKSRVGLTLENHLEHIFRTGCIHFSRTAITENRSKPDFLFPDQASYQNPAFNADQLMMLGVKSTCKDRWRQVLAEADRIQAKHLLTLEAPISVQQTNEMAAKHLTLVIPHPLQAAYTSDQRGALYSLADFILEVRSRQH